MAIVVLGRAAVPKEAEGGTLTRETSANLLAAVAIAGEERAEEIGSSWPGELVSLASVPVQPPREGMIASWSVHVGERVAAGQTLGVLSAPPAMPETLAMLAEERKMLAMAESVVSAKRTYTASRLLELARARANIERSLEHSEDIIGTGPKSANEFSMIAARQKRVRTMLESAFAESYPLLSGQGTLPARYNAITLKDAIGAQNSRLRDRFAQVVSVMLNDLRSDGVTPIASGMAYFDLAIALADASIPDGAMLTETELAMLKTMLHKDRDAFLMAVDELRETELMAVGERKMAVEQLAEIASEEAMVRQDLAMAEGDLLAKQESARAIERAASGPEAIVSPRSGIVSAITKNTGAFVEPGMPVAMVTGSANGALLVRFRIPANESVPPIGTELSVVRVGSPDAPRKAILIGVGRALDEGGTIMADAKIIDAEDWPVGVPVRVLSSRPEDAVVVPLGSIWWSASGTPMLWVVSRAGRISGREVEIGRSLGERFEILHGLAKGEQYLARSIDGITENMLLEDVAKFSPVKAPNQGVIDDPHAGHGSMPGMSE